MLLGDRPTWRHLVDGTRGRHFAANRCDASTHVRLTLTQCDERVGERVYI
jgi:hypothetical protein